MQDIDKEIRDIITHFWNKGWETTESCASHINSKAKPYICFNEIALKEFKDWIDKNKKGLALENKWIFYESFFTITPLEKPLGHIDPTFRREKITKEEHLSFLRDLKRISLLLPKNNNHCG